LAGLYSSGGRLRIEGLNLFPCVLLRNHPFNCGDIGGCLLWAQIAPRDLLGRSEFALEGKHKSKILARAPLLGRRLP
jgi:hypothetical protein